MATDIGGIEIKQGWAARRAFMRELPRRQRRELLKPWSDPIIRDRATAALAMGYGRYVWSWRSALEWLIIGLMLLAVAFAGRQLLASVSAGDLVALPIFYVVMLSGNLYTGHKLKRRAAAYLEHHRGDPVNP